jgi:5'-nucleotidase (lipoprotein e(P4) family)
VIAVARVATALALVTALGGCIAAAIPVVASSAIVRERMQAKREQGRAPSPEPTPSPARRAVVTTEGTWRVLDGAKALPPPSGVPAAPTAAKPAGVPPGMQYLYGSGEGAAASIQAYAALTTYLNAQVAAARKGVLRQAVLSDGASLNQPHFDACGKKPLAAVFDIDETALLNLGYEGDEARRGLAFDEARWLRWERTGADKVVAAPGAHVAIRVARALGVVVIFNSNRTRENAAQTAAALDGAGLGPVKHGTTLWLKGDDGGGSNKDDRRWAIATGYCVVALVGDQLGDFSDLFNDPTLTPSTRRALAASPQLAAMWGNGWFVLPNPVYGTALKGGADDIFPYDMRWTDPGEAAK